MFQSQSHFLAIRKNQLVEIVKDILQRFGICLIYFDDLGDTTCIEWLIFDVTKIAKYFLDFVLHIKNIKQIIMAEYLSHLKNFQIGVNLLSVALPKSIYSLPFFFKLNIFMDNIEVIKSISDRRSFKALQLSNKLQCLIISDEDAQKSAAALSVGIGSFSDPYQAQGIAHYLQHMLFMGTKKYPIENEYSNFLSKNAGSSNAFTSLEETNYYFQVAHNAFEEALDIFSRFFIDPLMLDSSSERELNAVHSQHNNNLQNDGWRKYQLSKHLSKQDHPYHKFSTGNKESLSNPNLREMLFKFYEGHYSSNLMKLVIYCQEDVQTAAKWVQEKFSEVKLNNFERFKVNGHPFDDKTLGKLIKLIPVKDKRTLQLSWYISDQSQNYQSPPSKYVSHILGHEGKGSLLSFLISQGLATALETREEDCYNSYSEFELSITLTDKGINNIKEVIGYVFSAINMLKENEPQQWIFDEIKKINKIEFDYLQKKQGSDYVSQLVTQLQKNKISEIFIHEYLMEEFRPDLIKDYVNQLTQNNFIAIAQSKFFQNECTEIEPIYHAKYTVIDLGKIQPLPCNISFPQKNFFIPEDLTVLPLVDQKYPKKFYQSTFLEVFLKHDHEYALPKAEIDIRVYYEGRLTPRDEAVRNLFLKLLKQKLRQFVYLADTAELESQLEINSYYTMDIKIRGFRDSFDRFMNPYLKEILQFVPNDLQLFQTLKQKEIKEYSNFFLNAPYRIAREYMHYALKEGSRVSFSQKLEQAKKITFEDIVNYSRLWKSKLYLEVYITGNISQDHTVNIIKLIESSVQQHASPLNKSSIGSIRSLNIPAGKISSVELFLQSKDETNGVFVAHYQHEPTSIKNKLIQELAYNFLQQPTFDYLRTKQQLGYIAWCLQSDNRGLLGFSFLVQSGVKNTYEVQEYVHKFINEILKEQIDELDEEQFEQYKESLLETKQQKDQNLTYETERFWGQIINHSYQFTRKEQEIEIIPTITLEEFKKYLSSILYDNPRIFELHYIPQCGIDQCLQKKNERLITNPNYVLYPTVENFKKKMPLQPDYYSHK